VLSLFDWVCLDALLDVMQHIGRELQQLFTLVLFTVYLD
jgi:hypothetical protein